MRPLIFTTALFLLSFIGVGQSTYAELSTDLINSVRNGNPTELIQKKLADVSIETLSNDLGTDEKRLTFWMNVYNAYVQISLTETPSLFNDRGAFFKKERVTIAGRKMSFDDIEHGIIRGSKWKLGLGIIPKPFPGKYERKLRIKKTDPRIHLALNCGAKSCPPVAAYEWKRVNEQMDKSTRMFLENTTDYDEASNEVTITPLFSWFRGDWGNKKKVIKFLKKHDAIANDLRPKIKYGIYDWTLSTGNFIDL